MDEQVIAYGEPIKSLGDNRYGGYLVRYSTPDDPDLTGDYFDGSTDFDKEFPIKQTVYFNHGMDSKIGTRKLGKAELRQDEFGIWAETILHERDEYEKFIADLARDGKVGWSSGSAGHLVRSTATGKANHIDLWPIIDASITHIPAEPRNTVINLKSLFPATAQVDEQANSEQSTQADEQPTQLSQSEPTNMEVNMSDETITTTKEALTDLVKSALDEYTKSMPAVNPPGVAVVVEHDPADNLFTTLAEEARSIKSFAVSNGRSMDDRLKRLSIKAGTGSNEGIPADGGFLLEPTLAAEILRPIHESGPFTSLVRRLPVSANSNYGWINGVDETSRATGSRWGGIRGYRLAEGATITASKPAFRRINWELRKYAVLVYATDELLADASQFSEIVRTGAGEELAFMANDDILNGAGTSGPLGILKSAAYVSVAKESSQAADTVLYENLIKMWARVVSPSKSRGYWFINTDVNPQLDKMSLASGTGALEPRFIGYDATGVMRIKGRPVVETEFNPTVGDLGDIMFIDPTMYLWWEKGGVQAASSIHLQFLTDEEVFRFVYRCDGQPAIASPLTPYKGVGSSNDTLSPFVALAARA